MYDSNWKHIKIIRYKKKPSKQFYFQAINLIYKSFKISKKSKKCCFLQYKFKFSNLKNFRLVDYKSDVKICLNCM